VRQTRRRSASRWLYRALGAVRYAFARGKVTKPARRDAMTGLGAYLPMPIGALWTGRRQC
jgi:hypothetical protein